MDATIAFAGGKSYEDALATLLKHAPLVPNTTTSTSAVLVPSSLDRQDVLVRSVRSTLRAGRVRTGVIVPESGIPQLLSTVTSVRGTAWAPVHLQAASGNARTVHLPATLAGSKAAELISVTDVDRVALRGPFVLDLLARYLHPRERIQLLAGRNREAAAAELNMTRILSRHLIGKTAPDGVVIAMTTDIIAAELLALALSEEALHHDLGVTGPWEDAVVQRATELHLGVLIPAAIRLEVVEDSEGTSPGLRATIERVALRLGIRYV